METGYLIPLKFCTQKGGVRVHLGTKFGEWSYLQLFTKNNTNVLSRPQGKQHMARS